MGALSNSGKAENHQGEPKPKCPARRDELVPDRLDIPPRCRRHARTTLRRLLQGVVCTLRWRSCAVDTQRASGAETARSVLTASRARAFQSFRCPRCCDASDSCWPAFTQTPGHVHALSPSVGAAPTLPSRLHEMPEVGFSSAMHAAPEEGWQSFAAGSAGQVPDPERLRQPPLRSLPAAHGPCGHPNRGC